MLRLSRIIAIDAGIAVVALAALVWYFLVFPIRKAERTSVGDTGLSFWEERYFDVDCSKPKYRNPSWVSKLQTSKSLNHWASRAQNAETAAKEYNALRKHKLSSMASEDAERYWLTVQYLKLELECFDVASAGTQKPY